MPTKINSRPRPVQGPKQRRDPRPPRRSRLFILSAAGVLALALTVVLLSRTGGGGTAGGLPETSDYHSLLVSASNPDDLRLGTHQGIYRSTDGGRSWRAEALAGQDAMNLARASGNAAVWMAGHNVFAKSTDGGDTWQPLSPPTLPSLDLHGFAVDPRKPSILYAAVAGVGLFRSINAGESFAPVSRVGGAVMALAVTSSGRVLAGDMDRGLLGSSDGGRTWREVLNVRLMGLAINPDRPDVILAAGPGILRSVDGGRHWAQTLELPDGAGPVAWSPSNPDVAFVVGFDRQLYRTADGGVTWKAVAE